MFNMYILFCCFQGIRKAGFYGDGFTTFKGENIPKTSGDVSLSFVTKQNNALLLLANSVDQSVSESSIFSS